MDQSTLNAALAIYASSLATTPFYNANSGGNKLNYNSMHNGGFNGYLTASPPSIIGRHPDGTAFNCQPAAQTPPTSYFPTPPNSAGGYVNSGSFFATGGNMLPVANGIHHLFPFPTQWYPNFVNPLVGQQSLNAHQQQIYHTNSSVAEFSFEDALKKIQNAMYLQNCSSSSPISSSPLADNEKAKDQLNLPRSPVINNRQPRAVPATRRNNSNNAVDKAPPVAPTPCSNLATLAEVASRLSPEQQPKSQSLSATTSANQNAAQSVSGQQTDSRLQYQTIQQHSDNNGNKIVSWAELASQLLAAAELQERVVAGMVSAPESNTKNHSLLIDSVIDDCVNKSVSEASGCQNSKMFKNSNRKRAYKRNSTPSAPMIHRIEDTIDSVIRLQCSANSPPATFPTTSAAHKHDNPPPTAVLRHTKCAAETYNEILDLSVKKKQRRSCPDDSYSQSSADLLPRPSSSSVLPSSAPSELANRHSVQATELRTKIICSSSLDSQSLRVADGKIDTNAHQSGEITNLIGQSSSRRVIDSDAARLPLSKGWRRQTCVRSVSASGVRGDVLYYSPCGKKFASIAEVARYLKKHADSELSMDYFSFSSKVIAGEYFHASPDGVKNISEKDVRRLLDNAKAGVKFFSTDRRSPLLCTTIKSQCKQSTTMTTFESADETEEQVASCIIDLIKGVSSLYTSKQT